MPERPRHPIPREEPDSDPPQREERYPTGRGDRFITRTEAELMIERALSPLHRKIDRVIVLQERSEEERQRRSEAEARSRLLAATVRTAEAIERATPVHSFPVQPAPTTLNSEPPKSRYRRRDVAIAIIAAISAIAVAAIGAYSSQKSSPHGVVEPAEHH